MMAMFINKCLGFLLLITILEICSHDSRQITIHVFSQVVENRGNTCYYPQQHCHHTLNALLEHPISFIQINFIYT